MKRLIVLAVMSLAVLATGGTRIPKDGGPIPDCSPCPWVR